MKENNNDDEERNENNKKLKVNNDNKNDQELLLLLEIDNQLDREILKELVLLLNLSQYQLLIDNENFSSIIEKINHILKTKLTNEIIDQLTIINNEKITNVSKKLTDNFLNPIVSNPKYLINEKEKKLKISSFINELDTRDTGSIFSISSISQIIDNIQMNVDNYKEFKIYKAYFEYFDFIMLVLKSLKDQLLSISKEMNKKIITILNRVYNNVSNKSLITFLLCLKHYNESSFNTHNISLVPLRNFKFPMIKPLLHTNLMPNLTIQVTIYDKVYWKTLENYNCSILILKLKEILKLYNPSIENNDYLKYQDLNNKMDIRFQLFDPVTSQKNNTNNSINSNKYQGQQRLDLLEYLNYLNPLVEGGFEYKSIYPLNQYSNISFVTFDMGFEFIVITDLFNQDFENYVYPSILEMLKKKDFTVVSFDD